MTDPEWPDPRFIEAGPCLHALNPDDPFSLGVCGKPAKPVPDEDMLSKFYAEIVVWLCSKHGGEDAAS
jgi:hypothetical protein